MPIDPIIFLDTSYIYALVNTRDQWHKRALRWEKIVSEADCQLLTTECILVEIANGLSALRFRSQAVRIIEALTGSNKVTILPAHTELLEAGFELYRSRNDKSWGLTDCMSFVAMEQQSI